MLKKIVYSIAFGGMLASSFAQAGSVSGRTITCTGCNAAGVCFVNMSGAAFGPAACSSTQVTWDGTTTEGKNFTASALSAKISGVNVRVGFDDVTCNGSTPSLIFMTIL